MNHTAWRGACYSFGVWLALGLACAPARRQPQPPPTHTSQFQGYESLTYDSSYRDVVAAMGKPDAEATADPPEAVIPNTMLAYKECKCVVFLIYAEAPKGNKFDKSKTRYVGTKGVSPEKVLHVSDERFRVLLDSYQLRGVR